MGKFIGFGIQQTMVVALTVQALRRQPPQQQALRPLKMITQQLRQPKMIQATVASRQQLQ